MLSEGVVAAENDKAFADLLNFRLKPQVSLKLAAETEGAIPLRRSRAALNSEDKTVQMEWTNKQPR